MRLRAHRRSLVIWSHSAAPAGWYGAAGPARIARPARIRRGIRIGALLAVMGMMRLGRGARGRWRPLLAGATLMTAGVVLGNGAWGVLFLAGFWSLLYAALIPASPDAERGRRTALERELAGYSTHAQRRDLEATLSRYPDGITGELRDVLAQSRLGRP
jgi:hypothetical protein